MCVNERWYKLANIVYLKGSFCQKGKPRQSLSKTQGDLANCVVRIPDGGTLRSTAGPMQTCPEHGTPSTLPDLKVFLGVLLSTAH